MLLLGFLIGYTLFHTNYGFASVYKQIFEDGNTEMLRGHMQKLLITTTLFALIISTQTAFFGENPEGALAPISTGLVIGSFLFGFGMNIGSNLAPQAMRKMTGGRTALLFTASGFLIGATIGAPHFAFWNTTLPNTPAVSIAEDTPLGFTGAWLLQTVIFATVIIGTYLHQKRKLPPPLPPMPRGTNRTEILFRTWPIWVGATAFALLNAAVLMVQGSPWKVTGAFTLWGSKLADQMGFDPVSWSYWGEQEPVNELTDSVFTSSISVLNFGIITGALITMALAGLFRFAKITIRMAGITLLGGLLMGYGATISSGANVGAYFSGIASMSLHAWIWTGMAVTGVYTAYIISRKIPFLASK
ncbi:YeeE/YedE thiosulfate transporter family protein [Salipaludibacillus sp. CF4.18]|uniref:YeeE/YedE thiosulfate transporter family protein n=1 Tax=Salipaludibacillus sp. CF4.18 TaxID=3373081 RepID=UPI003EE51B1F